MHRTFGSSAIARSAVAPLATARSLVSLAEWLLLVQSAIASQAGRFPKTAAAKRIGGVL